MTIIKFRKCTQAQYDALQTPRNSAILYFISDRGWFYLGDTKYYSGTSETGLYVKLDANNKINLAYLYDSILGQMEYVGTFDPALGYPELTTALNPNRVPRKGDYFIATGTGTIEGTEFNNKDWLIKTTDGWQHIDNTDAVASVNGKMGVVVLDGTDIQLGGGVTTTIQAKFVAIDQSIVDLWSAFASFYTKAQIDAIIAQYYTKDQMDTKVLEIYQNVNGAIDEVEARNTEKNSEQDLRIATIEEAYRKSQSGELTATKSGTSVISLGKDVAPAPLQVKVDGGLIPALENLVTNGDFSDGTSGWGVDNETTEISNVSGTLQGLSVGVGGNFSIHYNSSHAVNINDIMYFALQVKSSTTKSGGLRDFIGSSFTPFTWTNTTSFQQLRVVKTMLTALLDFDLYLSGAVAGDTMTIDNFMAFNLTKLFGVTATSGTAYDNAVANIETMLALKGGYISSTPIHAVCMNKRVRSVGKNLFDKSSIFNGYINDVNGSFVSHETRKATDFIKIKPNTSYYVSGNGGVTWGAWYDINKTFVSGNGTVVGLETSPSNAYYIRFTIGDSSYLSTVQLELGSTATTYAPYANTDLYLQANKLGYKLPNGVADTVEYRNGKYYYVQRVQKYTLQASDFGNMYTVFINLDYARLNKPSDYKYAGATSGLAGSYVHDTFIEGTEGDLVTNIGKTSINSSSTQIWYGFAKGTTLEQAKTALAGTNIYYQLATPIETEILALGNAQGLAGGTVYIDDVMADSNIYTSKYDIENTAYPIKALDRIVKINVDGSQTELAVSSAVIAGDGLSFTHPSLVANDIVWVAYVPNVANTFKSNTFVTYNDSPFVQEAWITPTLVNGWIHFGSPTYDASYMKDSMGFVHLRGRVKNGTIGSHFMVLPVGYRPTSTQSYAADSNAAFGRVVISSNGTVNCVVGSNEFVSIDGITFKAEA